MFMLNFHSSQRYEVETKRQEGIRIPIVTLIDVGLSKAYDIFYGLLNNLGKCKRSTFFHWITLTTFNLLNENNFIYV